MFKSARTFDIAILLAFVLILTFNPYFCDGEINLFETGIYLPGINALIKGGVPFKDVFHLRGPLEITIPAFLMKIFAEHLSVLYGYFSFGNILCMILCVLIAKELLKSRLMIYLLTPVLVGRTFPRVVYTFWGGMRFAYGLLAVLLLVHYAKKRKNLFLFFSGIVSSLSILTSIDGGLSVFLTTLGFLFVLVLLKEVKVREILSSVCVYLLGVGILLIPYSIYLHIHQAFSPFVDSIVQIVFVMTKTFPDFIVENQPTNFIDAIQGLNPASPFFKFTTPLYCYIFSVVYLFILRLRKKEERKDYSFAVLALFGFILYVFSFRKIGTSSFEMALQPEKILLFFLVEQALFWLKPKKESAHISPLTISSARIPRNVHVFIFYFCLMGVIGSSLGYSIARFNHRFFTVRYLKSVIMQKPIDSLLPYSQDNVQMLRSKRLRGIKTTKAQAKEIDQVVNYIQENTSSGDAVFTYPELGFFNFACDRPFVGRFPMVTFSWFGKGWAEEVIRDLQASKVPYAIVQKELPESFDAFYFRVKKNQNYHRQIMSFLQKQYQLVMTTQNYNIYRRVEE